jgi:hypothetical protein
MEARNGQSCERSDIAGFLLIALQNKVDRPAAKYVAREPSWPRHVGEIKTASS